MADAFFKWLSANPVATGFLLIAFALVVIAFVLIILIILRAAIRGDEIQTPLFKIGTRLGVQSGTVELLDEDKDRKKKSTFYEPGDFDGVRTLGFKVEFKPHFKRRPEVAVSLRSIDLSGPYDATEITNAKDIKDAAGIINAGKIIRLEVYTLHETRYGFELYFKTWSKSRVFNAAATWIAIGEA
jgi:hypothetical protein